VSYGSALRSLYGCWRCGQYIRPNNGVWLFVAGRKVRVGRDCAASLAGYGAASPMQASTASPGGIEDNLSKGDPPPSPSAS